MTKATIIVALLFCSALLAFAQEKPTTAPATSTAATKKTIQGAQERLLALGYQPGSTDGVMGARTIAALKKFQSDHGLSATGRLDRKTLDALNARPEKVATKPETKEPVVPAFVEIPDDIGCSISCMQYEMIVGSNETNGSVKAVTCWIKGGNPVQKKDIPLASTEITHGMLPTEQFGNLKITGSANLMSEEGLSMAIESSKVKSFREYLQK